MIAKKNTFGQKYFIFLSFFSRNLGTAKKNVAVFQS